MRLRRKKYSSENQTSSFCCLAAVDGGARHDLGWNEEGNVLNR